MIEWSRARHIGEQLKIANRFIIRVDENVFEFISKCIIIIR